MKPTSISQGLLDAGLWVRGAKGAAEFGTKGRDSGWGQTVALEAQLYYPLRHMIWPLCVSVFLLVNGDHNSTV